MQDTNFDPGEDELIRLLLKRQSELNALLEITRAINKNSSTPVLIEMMEAILQNHLNVGKLRLLIEKDGSFICISKYGGQFETLPVLLKACTTLKKNRHPLPLADSEHALLKNYSHFIPFNDKTKNLAYALIGDFNSPAEMMDNDLSFIQTLINAIILALQNKKLFRQRLEAERMQREMELASEVQNMLIPGKLHKDSAVEIGAMYLPHQNIGGDYFDFMRINEHELIWCIADVSGKGVSAALLMANFQASLRAWATVDDDLTSVIERLNSIVVKNTRGEKFITLFLAKYNQQTRKLTYINAGHNPSILYCNGQAMLLKLGTTMIGAFEELPFINQGEVDVDPGSLIINYTDGLMDYELNPNQRWNEHELLNFALQQGHRPPDKFNQMLMDHLNLIMRGKPIDDVTLLTLRVF
ncbi:PP2C family protein-serine/threonine phosphatase [Mucilaginibacter myungsuensis]|uniref:Serine/threonine-protein phosphatase n=1 Tax=Mucilaginibacter myungsuensis TaxID=649104 RepID=A0A929KVN2_9SPHI|nr:PP2C family protein-serine/threonine phosphatase [Mucilaginibacter myungsuensis]MBE9661300.1 serine/threonine-protein phosphatase [Mucilaginibacter myungsuensis]MDN3597443.1 PP2C family protein-serine/threonine phosphatase [Mucilaginibacter myungsuensis]